MSNLLSWTFDPNFWHPIPSSIVMHMQNKWIESSLINLHPFPFVMLDFEACFPCPKHYDPTHALVTLKLIWPKLVLAMVDIVLQQLPFYPTCVGFSTNVINNLLIISLLHDHGVSQATNVYFSMVLMSRTSFRSWNPPRFGFFYH